MDTVGKTDIQHIITRIISSVRNARNETDGALGEDHGNWDVVGKFGVRKGFLRKCHLTHLQRARARERTGGGAVLWAGGAAWAGGFVGRRGWKDWSPYS